MNLLTSFRGSLLNLLLKCSKRPRASHTRRGERGREGSQLVSITGSQSVSLLRVYSGCIRNDGHSCRDTAAGSPASGDSCPASGDGCRVAPCRTSHPSTPGGEYKCRTRASLTLQTSFASSLCTCQVNAHGAAIQIVPLDIGVPLPNWLAAWFLGNPVLRWVLSITVSVLSVAAGLRLGTFVGEAILPTAVLFGECSHTNAVAPFADPTRSPPPCLLHPIPLQHSC